ncbi:AbiV family abortive infection protein [Neorhizobium galegae]|uniref:AbiV family abortive infection protein n=2 Tax=Neorhizobium galegae TaxID=399 RepID=UPI0012FEA60C|nr:AbiV family abortive infection protein [Neorhizobium galegae]
MSEDIVAIDPRVLQQREACLDHAADLVSSAERILQGDKGYPNIAYHLALLALEEIGKSQLIVSRAVTGPHRDPAWIDKRLDNHVFKMLWAIWSSTLFTGPVDPGRFEEAKRFAQGLHEKRLRGLYVDFSEASAGQRPSDAVNLHDARSVLEVVISTLATERERKPVGVGGAGSDSAWFLETVANEEKQKRLFSRPFVEKLIELVEGRAWISWARGEFERIELEEQAALSRELERQKSNGMGRAKWQLQIPIVSRWHSVRQKVLNDWNSRVEFAQFFTGKNQKNGDLLLKLTLHDHISADQVFDAGLSLSKLVIAMLNIGSAGYFWFSTSELSDTYFDRAIDLDEPSMGLKISKPRGLSSLHLQLVPQDTPNRRDGLESAYIHNALKCLMVYSAMSEAEAAPIFGPYLHGLVLLSKSDINLSCENDARGAFLETLEAALKYFHDWDGEDDVASALDVVFSEIIPNGGHRQEALSVLGDMPETGETPISWAFHAKRTADIYLAFAADRQWRRSASSVI